MKLTFFLWLLTITLGTQAYALDLLPYSIRTQPYYGWSVSPRGDIRTVGMSGATVGLADTFIAALDNPAGLAMTLNHANTNLSTSSVYDSSLQSQGNVIGGFNFGFAINHYPWGLSIGYLVRTFEGQPYAFAAAPNDSVNLNISTQEFRFAAARLFFNNCLAVGASLNLGQGIASLNYTRITNYIVSSNSFTLSGNLGASFQLNHRLILGISYTPAIRYAPMTPNIATPGISGFYQTIQVPHLLGFGLGWIPNRFLRADFTTFIAGISENTALLKDNTAAIGQSITVQPRLGLAYQWIEYPEFKSNLFLGTYYESSLIQGYPNRLHGTAGLEVQPWIFSLGYAIDASTGYRNFILFLGIDFIKTMQKLNLIPPLPHPLEAGLLPRPTTFEDEGLPRPLVKIWNPQVEVNPIQVGLAIPDKIEQEAREISQNLSKVFKPKPKKKKPKSNSPVKTQIKQKKHKI